MSVMFLLQNFIAIYFLIIDYKTFQQTGQFIKVIIENGINYLIKFVK